MRQVPIKNYFILALLGIAVLGITFYLCNLYQKRTDNKYLSEMSTFMQEITTEDITNYVSENPIVVLYISDKSNPDIETFETEMKNLLIEYNIKELFVYIDISEESNNDLSQFNELYNIEVNYEYLPVLIVFGDGEILGIMNDENVNITKVTTLLFGTGVIENN